MVFLGSRNWAVEDSTVEFLDGMKKRLVVMLNSEDAASSFRVENEGKEFVWGGAFEIGKLKAFCEQFKEETYYYRSKVINNWPLVVFRAYPHPWEVHIQTLNGSVEKLMESAEKPNFDQIGERTLEYEAANGITGRDKMNAFRGS